jgi:hypothetical protein
MLGIAEIEASTAVHRAEAVAVGTRLRGAPPWKTEGSSPLRVAMPTACLSDSPTCSICQIWHIIPLSVAAFIACTRQGDRDTFSPWPRWLKGRRGGWIGIGVVATWLTGDLSPGFHAVCRGNFRPLLRTGTLGHPFGVISSVPHLPNPRTPVLSHENSAKKPTPSQV